MRRIVLRVHSGTGPLGTELAIALNLQNGLQVTHLPISDPVGMRRVSFLQGLGLFRSYVTGPRKNVPPEHRNDADHPGNPRHAFYTDAFVRGTSIWLRDGTYNNLVTIGNEHPKTAVLLHLPRYTLNGSTTDAETMAQDLRSKIEREDTFKIQLDYGFHSTEYDNLDRNVAFTREALKLSPLA